MNSSLNYVWRIAKRFFNALPDKTDETAIVEQISDGVTFRGANLWVLIFAIFIACLGLNLNSTAVIIGAMLISPLMGRSSVWGWPWDEPILSCSNAR